MKKLLLLVYLLSIAAFYGYSQSLSLMTPQGTVVTNSFITQYGTYDSLELVTYLHVKNISAQDVNIYAKKIEIFLTDSVETTMCWAGGCYSASTFVSPNYASIPAGQTATDFSGHYSTTTGHGFNLGESIVRWVFFNDENHNDSVYITVKYSCWSVAVDDKSQLGMLSNIYPNPADARASFSYAIPSGSNGEIIIRNLVGATVQTEQVSTASGKITMNTFNLADGIYFCSLVLDGKISQTKKLVVRH